MPEAEERFDNVEKKLGAVETGLKEVRDEVRGLRGEVNRFRVLGEKNAEDIKKIAEVQSHHGRTLDEHGKKLDAIADALKPLSDIQDFIRRIAPNHEIRIEALEKHTGISH